MSPSRSPNRVPLIMGLVAVVAVMGLCAAFVIGLLRTQERERAAPATGSATVGHWSVAVSFQPGGNAFQVVLRHLDALPATPPSVTLTMAGMGSTALAVRPLTNGIYGASGSLSMRGDARLIVEDGDSTAEIPLPGS